MVEHEVLALCMTCGVLSPGDAPSEHAENCPAAPEVEAIPFGPVLERISWDDYFFSMARLVGTRATCPRASVGCVIVEELTHRVLATGYNGSEPGEPHCRDVGCQMLANHCVATLHAEANAAEWVLVATHRDRVADLVAYVVGPREVCSHCARLLWEAGVRDVRWGMT